MKLHELNSRIEINDLKWNDIYGQFKKLLEELEKRELPDEIAAAINKEVDEINSITDVQRELKKQAKQRLQKIVKLIEKELKLVPRNYYKNVWMAMGIAVFGVPMGVVFGTSLGNMAYLGIGLPIGLGIGLAVGDGMDKKALKEGRQLDVEIKS